MSQIHRSVWIVQWFSRVGDACGVEVVFDDEDEAWKLCHKMNKPPQKKNGVDIQYAAHQWIVTPKKK